MAVLKRIKIIQNKAYKHDYYIVLVQVDLNIKYSWTKNGRFIDIQTDRIFLESDKKGKIAENIENEKNQIRLRSKLSLGLNYGLGFRFHLITPS